MDKHELHAAVIQLASELERTPTKMEFCDAYAQARSALIKHYRDQWNAFLLAAGLRLNNSKKITNDIFNKDIEKHIENFEPREIKNLGPYPSIAVISDIHWPFENKKVLEKFYEYVGDVKPQYVFINGDAWDMYSHSKFPRSHNIFTPRQEQAMSRKCNEDFWNKINRISGKSKKIQMLGNHSVRPMKRIMEVYPEAEDWIAEKLKEIFTYQGVETINDSRKEYVIREDILVFHGYRSKLGDHRDYTLTNCINGHTHKGGVTFRQIRGQVLWELNSGLAGNPEAKGLSYGPQKITVWTPGFGIVNKHGPQFIHL
jgi:predicted phosphodiesterase